MTTAPDEIRTPAVTQACAAVFGAGIAGLTAAHELVERGFRVTVYEQQLDERDDAAFGGGTRPPVKLGGLAASHWAKRSDGGHNQLDRQVFRVFPGSEPPEDLAPDYLPGEHGFRFFPAYYLHIWDTMQRIPQYEARSNDDGSVRYTPTARTVYDNVERVITQAMTTSAGKPNAIFSRAAPQSIAEAFTAARQMGLLGFEASDLAAFSGRMSRYQAMGPERRRREMQRMSAYDFFVDPDPETLEPRIVYSDAFEHQLRDMPKVLAAFDSVYGDARTNIDTYLQLQLNVHRANDKVDAILNGPTSEAWFDHWYRHLDALGVTFEAAQLLPFELDDDDQLIVEVKDPGGHADTKRRIEADYVVVATDAVTAERACAHIRDRVGGTVSALAGYTSSRPTNDGPSRLPGTPTAPHRDEVDARNPYKIDEVGTRPWDRFQTLSGIQYYFDTEFQLVRGHVYVTGSDWGLSSINQSGMWQDRPSIRHNRNASQWLHGYNGVLSIDIGDWRKPSSHTGRSAIESTDDEIAAEVWRQFTEALLTGESTVELTFPRPTWYTLDRNLITDEDGRITLNLAPYLVPIVNDWERRPGGPPWNPHGGSPSFPPTAEALAAAGPEHYWEAAHGGYQVHCSSLVFAGTWAKTFTRMTSMESANESARHAVNAILDHYIHANSGDPRGQTGLSWRIPYGFLDERGSGPVRQPTPVGDYCFVYDLENFEPAQFRPIRNLDDRLAAEGLPHPWESLGIDAIARSKPKAPAMPALPGLEQLMGDLRAWTTHLESLMPKFGAGPPTMPGAPTTAPPDPSAMSGHPGVVGPDDGLAGRTVVTSNSGDPNTPTTEADAYPLPPGARIYRPGGVQPPS